MRRTTQPASRPRPFRLDPVGPRAGRWGVAVALAGLVSSCGDQAAGVDPPNRDLFFPMGLAIHPDPAKQGDTLYVACGNNDLAFNGGAIQAYDLDRLWRVIDPSIDPEGPDGLLKRKVQPPTTSAKALRLAVDGFRGADLDDPSPDLELPCRAVAGKTQVIECEERAFSRNVRFPHTGSFITDLDAWQRGGKSYLMAPVRGDPAVYWFELDSEGDATGRSPFCGQQKDGDRNDGVDEARCDDDHRLTNLFNQRARAGLPIEPYSLTVSPDPEALPYAYVGHTGSSAITLISLEGAMGLDGPERPVIVDFGGLAASTNITGGYGIAQRPCDPADPPGVTQNCTRPLAVTSLRFDRLLTQFTASKLLDQLPEGTGELTCRDLDQPLQETDPGEVECNAQLEADLQFSPGGLVVPGGIGTPTLGATAYSEDGDELFVVQTNPGALIRLDTSVDDTGEVLNFPSGQVEVCSRANELSLFEDPAGNGRFGLVSCYLVGQIYVVDLDSFQVVAVVQTGTGPHHMEPDLARKVVYVANSLDATVSVIDMNRDNRTRFSEIARLGLQEPFSGDRG